MLQEIALILSFCSMLGSNSFRERDLAQGILENANHPAILLDTPVNYEAEIRLKRLQKSYRSKVASEWYDKRKYTFPWISSKIPNYQEFLQNRENKEKEDFSKLAWPNYRVATGLYLRGILAESLDFQRVNSIIEELKKEESDWWTSTILRFPK